MTTQAPFEYRAVFSLALLFIVRMLGLFMVLPVLALYSNDYAKATPILLGLALGIYGFSQALLQMPFGVLSDRFGRKPLLALGLVIFALGSVVAANAETIYGLIIGRGLQGAGAIAGVIIAMVADLTQERNRSKAMAFIGASIGMAFSLALILGPFITTLGGIKLIFWISAGLAVLGLVVLFWLVPKAPRESDMRPALIRKSLATIVSNRALQQLNWGVFVLHFVLMALFLVLPVILEESLSIDRQYHYWWYLVILTGSFVAMLPMILLAEKYRYVKAVFINCILLLVLATLILSRQAHIHQLIGIGAIWLFFIGFNYLEATLPSLMSKAAPAGEKGSASGAYSTCQFAGAGSGGFFGGWLLTHWGITGVFAGAATLLMVWLIVALTMTIPPGLNK